MALLSPSATAATTHTTHAFGARQVLLATTQDGASLDAEGPRLVVPGDVKGGRYVSGVAQVYIGDVDRLVGRH